MLGSGNPLVNNNIINRHSQYNQEFMMNNPNNNNMNNLNKNMKNMNARIGLNLNLNKNNNNNNIKIGMNKQNNFMNNMNRNLNIKNNANAANNMNRNINPNNNNNNMNSDNVISRALSMIRAEFKKKDDRIRTLQLKVEELEKEIELITNNKAMNTANNYNNNINENNRVLNNNYMNIPHNNTTQKKIGKNFTFSEKISGELDYNNNLGLQNNYDRTNKIQEMNFNNNYMRNNELNNRNINYQSNSNNQYRINTMEQPKYTDDNNDAQRENSIKTWNSGNYHGFSKNDVKLYLKEVKSKLDPDSFHEFIRNIKLLTSSKEEGKIDRRTIVGQVRDLLLEKDGELFEKFKEIIGYNE